jgi:hypothetical protein
MSAQHTPGPWAVETPMGESAPWIVQDGKQAYEWEPIATLGDCTEDDLPKRSKAQKTIEANARLIAAAPELLEALEDLLRIAALWEILDRGKNIDLDSSDAARAARAAIAKARGESPSITKGEG